MRTQLQTSPELAILLRTRQLLEGGWCRGFYARDRNNASVPFDDPGARTFCMHGALYRAEYDVLGVAMTKYVRILREMIRKQILKEHGVETITFNDSLEDSKPLIDVLNSCIEHEQASLQAA